MNDFTLKQYINIPLLIIQMLKYFVNTILVKILEESTAFSEKVNEY